MHYLWNIIAFVIAAAAIFYAIAYLFMAAGPFVVQDGQAMWCVPGLAPSATDRWMEWGKVPRLASRVGRIRPGRRVE